MSPLLPSSQRCKAWLCMALNICVMQRAGICGLCSVVPAAPMCTHVQRTALAAAPELTALLCSAAAPRRQDGNLASVAHASFLALVYGKYQYEASDRRGLR